MPAAARRLTRRVAGVDGCRGGWVAAVVPVRGRGPTVVHVGGALADVLAAAGPVEVVAIDMLLSLPTTGTRPCDDAARRRLGPRRSSVFPAPLACTVGADDHAAAVRAARAAGGPAPSIQAYNLLPKIVEAMAVAAVDDRLREASPELSFAVLAGAPLTTRKRTPAGAEERRALLVRSFPTLGEDVRSVRGAARDDVLDAYALAWTARRIAGGTAERLGDAAASVWV